MKKAICFLFSFMFLFTFIFSTKIIVQAASNQQNKLYAVDVKSGKYKGYKAIKGYPEQKKFQLYIKGTHDSYITEVADLRKINLNQIITWKYKGKVMKTKVKTLFDLFNYTEDYSSRLGIDDKSELSIPWFEKTFGKVYDEYYEEIAFNSNTGTLVDDYFRSIGEGLSDVSSTKSDDKIQDQWINDDQLYKKGAVFEFFPKSKFPNGTGVTDFCSASTGEIIYSLPDLTDVFDGEQTFSGIRFRWVTDEIEYNVDDLKAKGIIK